MRHVCPQCVHISSRRGIFHYRRRLPERRAGEVLLSLGTRDYREARHLAGLLDEAFDRAAKAVASMTHSDADIRQIVRTYLVEALELDAEARASAKSGRPVYTSQLTEDHETAADADADVLDYLDVLAKEALLSRDLKSVQPVVDTLAERYGILPEDRNRLALGILEANVELYRRLRERVAGREFTVLTDDLVEPAKDARGATPPEAPKGPPLSQIVPLFNVSRRNEGTPAHTIQQDERTFEIFVEIAGDKTPGGYGRGDVTRFLETLAKLPKLHGRSPRYRKSSLEEVIAAANADNAPRLNPKTQKRHLSALSQLFTFCVNRGDLRVSDKEELFKDHKLGKSKIMASKQRDAWTMDELRTLFASPVWTGSHRLFRSKPGPHVIRDAKFWLPLLALFHGCRLEEFADLYARDVDQFDGIPFVNLTNEERRLKNVNAVRLVPLHPEVIRIGFLNYVKRVAPNPNDPLFPDLEPRGADKRRGPNITKWFKNYRESLGLYRPGVGMHAFRHNANTRMRDRAKDYQQARRIDHLFGHARVMSEGADRYDKGPELQALADALSLLQYPELDFTRLYETDSEAGEAAVSESSGD